MTKQELVQRYKLHIDYETIGYNEYLVLLNWVEQNEGTFFGSFISNKKLKSKLPENFVPEISCGQYRMINIDTKNSHLVAYNSEPLLSTENFKKHDSCYGSAALERINHSKLIIDTQIDSLLEQINIIEEAGNKFHKAQEALKQDKILGWVNNPIYHSIFKGILPEKLY